MEDMMMYAEDGGMGDFFDQIDDLLDFANNDNHLLGIEDLQQHEQLLPLPSEIDDHVFQPPQNYQESQQFEVETNDIDIIPLEWMSQFLEDSDTIPDTSTKLECFSSSSPISVIQPPNNNSNANTNKSFSLLSPSSSSSSSASSSFPICDNNNDINQVPISTFPARTRSKRTRSATPAVASLPRITIALKPTSCSPTTTTPITTITSESTGDSPHPNAPSKKKKKAAIKNKMMSDEHLDGGSDIEPENNNANIRKCMHCEITKTPQWRLGPMGPKTLCNACGVRYKSGRLFPEYRPAASPTFVASIHSNSHKKVVEMRNKGANKSSKCELLDYIRMQRVN